MKIIQILIIYFSDREDITSEHVLEVLYLEQQGAPEPQDSVNHDDWVSGVDIHSGLILILISDFTKFWFIVFTKKYIIILN